MLCYATLRYATLRYATLCYAMLRYATLCYVKADPNLVIRNIKESHTLLVRDLDACGALNSIA